VSSFRRALAIAAALAAIAAASLSLRAADAPLVITNVTVLAGEALQPQAGTVVVSGGLIQSIAPGSGPAIPGAALVDGHGGYLVPGFIDMHAHLMVPRCVPGPDGSVFDRAVSERMLSVLLDFGITSVRSPATPTIPGLHLRDDLNMGRVLGPRAQASADLIDDPSLSGDALRRLVRGLLPFHPDYLKVYSRLGPDAVATVVEEAHAHGLPVIGHLGQTSWLEGARAGIDFLTHAADWSAGTLPPDRRQRYADAVTRRGALRARIDWLELLDVRAPAVRDTIAEIARHDISIDPTLIAYDTKFAAPQGGVYKDDPYAGVVPEMFEDWKACTHSTDDWTADDYRRWNVAVPTLHAFVRALSAGGVRLTTGTDVTNPWVIPGESLHQEFALLVHAGFTPRDVLQMTWGNAARALHRQDVGVIEAGRRADLVLLRDDPLRDIGHTRSLVWVMKDGRIVSFGPHRAKRSPRPAATATP
jgi:imidazolonepropionase-like amidohydrolase